MSTEYHDPILPRTPVTAESVNAPMGQLDEAVGVLYQRNNPTGNLVLDGLWDGRHIVMGNVHIWAHEGGLYWRPRPPTSGDDGFRFPEA